MQIFQEKIDTLQQLNSTATNITNEHAIIIHLGSGSVTELIDQSIISKSESNSTMSNITSSSNDSFVAFVRVFAPFAALKTEFHQFEVNANNTFGEMLINVMDFHVDHKFLNQNESNILMQHDCKITFHANEIMKLQNRIFAEIDSSLLSLKCASKYYVLYHFISQDMDTKVFVPRKNMHNVLMVSQNKLCIPKRELGLNYPASLYNFLLRIYEVKNLNVSIMSLNSLENLTKTTRNVLQSIDNQIAKSFIPTVFHHNIKTYDGRKRISNKFLTASAAQLLDAMNKSFDFLSTNKWKGYHTYSSHLYDTTLLCVVSYKCDKEV